jgi:hypothetical protein
MVDENSNGLTSLQPSPQAPAPVQVDSTFAHNEQNPIPVPQYNQKADYVTVDDRKPSWSETGRALWNENDFHVIGNAVYNFTYPPSIDHTPDPDFNPLKAAEGTPLAGQTAQLIGFKNKAELDYAVSEANKRQHDRETIAANGALGVGLSLVNGGLSPASFLPIALGPKVFGQFGRAAMSGAVGAAAMEPFYQANDPTRTYDDALKSVAASTLVAGVLGKSYMWVGDKKRAALEAEINKIRENGGLNAGQNPVAAYDFDNNLAPNAPASVKVMRDHNGNTAIWDGAEYVDITDKLDPTVPLEQTIAQHYGLDGVEALRRTDQATPELEGEVTTGPDIREAPELEHHDAITQDQKLQELQDILAEKPVQSERLALDENNPAYAEEKAQYEAARNAWWDKHADKMDDLMKVVEGKWGKDAAEAIKLPDGAMGTGGGLSAQSSDTRKLIQKEITPEFLRPLRDKTGQIVAGLAKTVPGGHYVADTATAIGRAASIVGKSPIGIIMENSYSRAARSLLLDFVETSRQLDGDEIKAPGGAFSTKALLAAERIQVDGLIALEDGYANYRYGTTNPGFRQRGTSYWPGSLPDGKMNYSEFNHAVFMAMNKGDVDINGDPHVTQVARDIRKVLDPWLARGQEVMHDDGLPLFSKDMAAPLGADSWISHGLNHSKVDNDWEGFVGMIFKSMKEDQTIKAQQKEEIGLAHTDVQAARAARERIAQRIETIDRRMKENEIRFKERAMARAGSASAEERAADRTSILKTARKQIQEEIDALRDDAMPENRETIRRLEEELKELKAEAEPSASELEKLERQDVDDYVYDDDTVRQALQIAVGRRKPHELPSLIRHIAESGGVFDDGGDILSALGGINLIFKRRERDPQIELNGKKAHPMYGSSEIKHPLIRDLDNSLSGGNTLNDWANRFRDHNPGAWPEGLEGEEAKNEIIGAIQSGEDPEWWKQGHEAHAVNQLAERYAGTFKELGVEPKNVREAVQALRNGDTAVARRLRSMLDAAAQTGQAGEATAEAKLAYAKAKRHLDKLLKTRGVQDAKVKGAEAAERLVGSATSENKGRLRILEDRMANQYEAMRALRIMESAAEREEQAALARREKLLEEWAGNSSKDVKNAIKDREAAAEAAGDAEGAPRRASADSAADDAVRAILNSERDLSDGELMDRANATAHRWRGSPNTIVDYTGGASAFSDGPPSREGLRGSMKRRTVPIPIEDKIKYLETDMRTVLGSISRTLPVDVMMTEKYGSPEMTRVIDGVREDYDRMLSAERARRDRGLITQREYKSIEKNMRAQAKIDLELFKDMNLMMRNQYGYSSDPTNQRLVRVARGLRNWASMTSLGRATINSLTDAGFGAALKYGTSKVFKDQWGAYAKVIGDVPQELLSGKETALTRQLKREARALLIGTETMLTMMTHDIDHVTSIGMGNKFERTLAYGANRMQFLNGMLPWTDNVKMATMLMATQQFADAAERMFNGKGTALDISRFAESNIAPHEAAEIGRMFAKYGSSERGVRFSNVDDWVADAAEQRAAELYQVAMKREVNTIVPTSGIGLSPIWMSHPLAGVLGMFMNFVYASHEQFYLANMQRLHYRQAGALAYGAGLGALSYYAYKMSKGEKPTDNPGQLAKEVVDRMAVLPLYNEVAKRVSKVTMGKADIWRAVGADEPLSRRADSDFFDEMLGPGAGVLKKGLTVAGAGAARVATGDPKYFQGRQLRQARQLMPFSNHFIGAPLVFDGGEEAALKFWNLKPTKTQRQMMNGQ